MANYFVRIEMYDAGIEQYEALHDAMELLHMNKYFHDGTNLKALPDGTYTGISHLTSAQLRDSIMKISSPLSSKVPSIFVCDFNSWASHLYPCDSNS